MSDLLLPPDPKDDPDYDWNAEFRDMLDEQAEEYEEVMAAREAWDEKNRPAYAEDLVSGKISLPPRLFEDFLFSRSLVMVSGESHAGKSMFLLAMLASLDLHEPLFGVFQPAESKPVLFLGQDSPPWDYQHQLSRLAWGMSDSPHMRSICLFNRGIDLLHPSFMPWLAGTVEAWGTRVLMIDTILEHHNQDENSNEQMKKVMGVLKAARDKHRLTVIFTHHLAKPAAGTYVSANYRARGASCIVGSVDQHILIKPIKSGTSTGMKLFAPKLRGGDIKLESLSILFESNAKGNRQTLMLKPVENPYGEREAALLTFISQPRTRQDIVNHITTLYPHWTPDQVKSRVTNSLRYMSQVKKTITRLSHGTYGPAEVK